ncbi:hypothetical protein [Streptomyces monomycini]|uniref:hypothetical protein n=1 Tax=Streptomyces monomycini TaxID=371720 RepID=UPI0004ABC710|nr:hypothetical protein [Streptomyces monomycini]
MTTYETSAVPGQLQPPAPLDPQAVRQLARHALDILMPAAVGPKNKTLGCGMDSGRTFRRRG